jgi:phosphatidate cytidylyltransferase
VTEPVVAASGMSELNKRIVSAIVMATIAIGVTVWGGWAFAVVWVGAAFAVAYEWQRLVHGEHALGPTLASFATVALAGVGAWLLSPWFFVAALLGIAASALLSRNEVRTAAATGAAYAAALGAAALLCRADSNNGMIVIFWLFGVVWGPDILAYFTGRALGGPRLWPRISPKKTWSGAMGGLVGGVLIGSLLLLALGIRLTFVHVLLSVVFSVLTQCGDLYESSLKRRFDAKDSGSLIPGHGGFMDRLDGFTVAVVFAALFGALRGGLGNAPEGLLAWN